MSGRRRRSGRAGAEPRDSPGTGRKGRASPPPTWRERRGISGGSLAAGEPYLDGLAVVDFDYVEVKTVNPFARRDEIAPLFVEIPAHVHEDLREKDNKKQTGFITP